MHLDANMIAAVGLIIGALTLGATLIAPRLVKQLRIFYERRSFAKVPSGAHASGLSVEVFHKGVRVESPVFLQNSYLENSGSRDITKEEFINPIEIRTENGFQIVSLDIDTPKGVGANLKKNGTIIELSWDILKPRERINIAAAVTTKLNIKKNDEYPDALSINMRLRDVKMGRGWFSALRMIPASKAILLIMLIFVSTTLAIQIVGDLFQDNKVAVYYDPVTKARYSIRMAGESSNAVERCPYDGWAPCKPMKFNDGRVAIATSHLESKSPHRRWAPLAASVLIPLLVAATVFGGGWLRRLRNEKNVKRVRREHASV